MNDAVAVTFVSSHARLGGEENYLLRLIDALGPAWVRNVICLEDAPFVERLREHGIRTDVIPTGPRVGIVSSAFGLHRALRSARPDVVHANGVKAAVVAALATTGLRVPLIWVKHDFSWDGLLARWVARRCTQVVGVSSFRADAVELIAGSDLVVIPSTVERRGLGREGFPYVGLEAMALGTPIVGYEHGGLPEMLGDCGLLVAPGDRSALRDAILELLGDRELCDRLARCGRERVRERFSLEKMVEAMKGCYREASFGSSDGRP